MVNTKAKETLSSFLLLLKSDLEESKLIQKLLDDAIISENFELSYLYQLARDERQFSKVEILQELPTKINVYLDFNSDSGSPYRIEMSERKGEWQIDSFKFQCISCFGTDEKCGVCGGSGWGML